jgi:Ner family transcriptional regulator
VPLRSTSSRFAAELGGDWDRFRVISELHRIGLSLRQLSFRHGYRRNTLRDALDRPYPKAEKIIARALGVAPSIIWPARYYRRRQQIKKASPK